MDLHKSELWLSDLDEIVESLPELEAMAGKNVLITGCTGLVGSAVVDVIVRWNETRVNKIGIMGAGRSTEKIKSRFSYCSEEEWFNAIQYDSTSIENELHFPCDYIIHGAGNATPIKSVKEPVATMLSSFLGVKYLLDYAKANGTKRTLFVSSSEVYGKKTSEQPFKIDEYGYVDLLNARNSYSVGKRSAENLCVCYSDEYGVETVIARPGHVYGPTASEFDNRVSSAWAYAVARGEDIVMKSDGSQIRSYCFCLDCASALLKVLSKGENTHAYNISNPRSIITIRKMAEIFTKYSGVKLKVELPTENEKKGFNPMNNSSLDSSELIELGWQGLFDAERGFSHTVKILRDGV